MSDSMPLSPASPEANAQHLVQAGIAASQDNDPARALALFTQARDAAPTWAIPQFLLGSQYAAAGDMEKAEANMANAVLLDPGLHVARYQLGLLQFSSGRAAMALLTWRPLAEGNVGQGLAQFVRGFVALVQDQDEEARAYFLAGMAAPDVNPSMVDDIRQVLARIDSLAGKPATEAESHAPDAAQSEAAHVLVSAYGKSTLH